MEDGAKAMIDNTIHKLQIIDDQGKLLGVVTITDLAVFLSPSRRPGHGAVGIACNVETKDTAIAETSH